MKILVTGANGLVGSRVCEQLSLKGHEVLGVGRGARRAAGSWRYVSVELTQQPDVLKTALPFEAQAIIHTAAMTEVDACEKAPHLAWAANVDAALHLARVARETGAHLVNVSSDYVFDGNSGPYSEEDIPNPRGVYATTKLAGELAVRVLAPSWAIARTAVVYGWPAAGRPNFGSWILSALEKGQAIPLFEDQFVSPTLADSLAEMLCELALRQLPGIWHTSGADILSRFEFARVLCQALGFDESLLKPTRMADLKRASPRPYRSGLKVEKAQRELQAKPLNTAEALGRLLAARRVA